MTMPTLAAEDVTTWLQVGGLGAGFAFAAMVVDKAFAAMRKRTESSELSAELARIHEAVRRVEEDVARGVELLRGRTHDIANYVQRIEGAVEELVERLKK